jgi:hypothetical protein
MSEKPDYESWPVERWTFAGVRANGTVKQYAWIDPSGEELWYKPHGTPAIGMIYETHVMRDGKSVRRTDPRPTGQINHDVDRLALEAQDVIARRRLADITAERRAKGNTALDEALAPLLEISRKLTSHADREAFAAMITRRILNGK